MTKGFNFYTNRIINCTIEPGIINIYNILDYNIGNHHLNQILSVDQIMQNSNLMNTFKQVRYIKSSKRLSNDDFMDKLLDRGFKK